MARRAFQAANWTIRATAGFKARIDCLRYDAIEREHAAEVQARLIREIYGNPFQPSVPVEPAWRQWREGTVVRLAEIAYEERSLPAGTLAPIRLGLLADALLDAGCGTADLLEHLREPGPHYRGCWAVDLVLGKS